MSVRIDKQVTIEGPRFTHTFVLSTEIPDDATLFERARVLHALARQAQGIEDGCPDCFSPPGVFHNPDCYYAPGNLIDHALEEAGL